jgi:hypothetical protein
MEHAAVGGPGEGRGLGGRVGDMVLEHHDVLAGNRLRRGGGGKGEAEHGGGRAGGECELHESLREPRQGKGEQNPLRLSHSQNTPSRRC